MGRGRSGYPSGRDFLLIYRIDPHPEAKDMEIVIFKRLGTHSDLFG